MRRLTRPAIVLAIVAAGGLFWAGGGGMRRHKDDASTNATPTQVVANAKLAAQDAARGVVTVSGDARASQDAAVRYKCPDNTPPAVCGANPLYGLSPAESQWLAKNGYPTAEEVEAVDTQHANLTDLKLKAEAGDLVARGLYARALVNSGRFDDASNMLARAISEGSLFAVYELSRVYGAKDFPNRDIHESAGYLRAAYLLGDQKASQRFYNAYPTFGTADFAMADQRGQELMRAILELRRRAGTGPVQARPPG